MRNFILRRCVDFLKTWEQAEWQKARMERETGKKLYFDVKCPTLVTYPGVYSGRYS